MTNIKCPWGLCKYNNMRHGHDYGVCQLGEISLENFYLEGIENGEKRGIFLLTCTKYESCKKHI